MKIITAPELYIPEEGEITCFLAGGICGCENWQTKTLETLQKVNPEHLVIFNPRREDFPIDNPEESERQIGWEFMHLERADIFSIYFCGGESVQPIALYELGRNLYRMQTIYPDAPITDHVVITVADGYKRKQDVMIQVGLACDAHWPSCTRTYKATPEMHATDILCSYYRLKYGEDQGSFEKYMESLSVLKLDILGGDVECQLF